MSPGFFDKIMRKPKENLTLLPSSKRNAF